MVAPAGGVFLISPQSKYGRVQFYPHEPPFPTIRTAMAGPPGTEHPSTTRRKCGIRGRGRAGWAWRATACGAARPLYWSGSAISRFDEPRRCRAGAARKGYGLFRVPYPQWIKDLEWSNRLAYRFTDAGEGPKRLCRAA